MLETVVKIPSSSHVFWVLMQQFFIKGILLMKFFVAARLLGPDQIGAVGIALAALAISEGLSETGFLQAIIHRKSPLTKRECGSVWTLLLFRGGLIFLVFFSFSGSISDLFGARNSSSLIELVAFIPLVRGASNPRIMSLQKNRRFKSVFFVEVCAAFLDVFLTFSFIALNFGAESIVYGNLAAESSKFLFSWIIGWRLIRPNFKWSLTVNLRKYGKWIWVSSVFSIILNQFDKVLVSRWLGSGAFGIYQTGSRISQLVIAELAIGVANYLFPSMSKKYAEQDFNSYRYFLLNLRRVAFLTGLVATVFSLTSNFIVDLLLGSSWSGLSEVIHIQILTMWFGALIAICVAHLRAIGKPRLITIATSFQLLILVLPAYWVISTWKITGIALLVCLAVAVNFFILLFFSRNERNTPALYS